MRQRFRYEATVGEFHVGDVVEFDGDPPDEVRALVEAGYVSRVNAETAAEADAAGQLVDGDAGADTTTEPVAPEPEAPRPTAAKRTAKRATKRARS